MIRTFIAVELDPMLKQAIAGVQGSLKDELYRLESGVRLQWVRPDSMHLTLKFLGDIEEGQVGCCLAFRDSRARLRASINERRGGSMKHRQLEALVAALAFGALQQ